MRTRVCVWLILVLSILAQPVVRAQWEVTAEIRLSQELVKARLNRFAVFVQQASEGKSRLLVASGENAGRPSGGIVMMVNWMAGSFANVYRVSDPFDADLDGAGECRVLGVVVLSVGGTMLGSPQKIDSGVYMLAFRPESKTDSKGILLIDSRVRGDGRLEHRVLGKGALDPRPTDKGASSPYVEAWFPDATLGNDDSPYSRLNIDMAWKNESYLFRLLDMDIWMI